MYSATGLLLVIAASASSPPKSPSVSWLGQPAFGPPSDGTAAQAATVPTSARPSRARRRLFTGPPSDDSLAQRVAESVDQCHRDHDQDQGPHQPRVLEERHVAAQDEADPAGADDPE